MKPHREPPGQAMINELVAGPWRSGSSLNQAASIQLDDSSKGLLGHVTFAEASRPSRPPWQLHWHCQQASLVAQTVKNLSAMQETRVHSLGWEDPLEKEMATHSSIPAWRIPWREEPGGLQFMGSQRVRRD